MPTASIADDSAIMRAQLGVEAVRMDADLGPIDLVLSLRRAAGPPQHV